LLRTLWDWNRRFAAGVDCRARLVDDQMFEDEQRGFSQQTQSFECSTLAAQSRKATLRMARDWLSVFITTRCQPRSVIVAWSGWRPRPLTWTPAFRRIERQPQRLALGLPARIALYRAAVTPFGWRAQT